MAARLMVHIAKAHEIHDLIAELRAEQHHTRSTLADATGFNKAQVRDWETASKRPNLDTLIRLADALGYRVALVPIENP